MKHMTLGTCTDPPGPKHKLWVRGGGGCLAAFHMIRLLWFYNKYCTCICIQKNLFTTHSFSQKKTTFEVTLSHPLTELHVWSQFSLNIYVLNCDRTHPKKYPLYVQKYSKCILTTWNKYLDFLCVWGGAEDHQTHRRDILCHYRRL